MGYLQRGTSGAACPDESLPNFLGADGLHGGFPCMEAQLAALRVNNAVIPLKSMEKATDWFIFADIET